MDPVIFQNILIGIFYVWCIFWKGVALWRSAKLGQRNWFVVILILNSLTFGLLEIVYLLRFANKRLTLEEMKGWKDIFVKRVPEKRKR